MNVNLKKSPFRIRAIVVKINPRNPVYIGCGPDYLVKNEPSSEFEANIIWLQTNDYGKATSKERQNESDGVILISLDALYVGQVITESISNYVLKYTQAKVLVVASHTHNAPMLDSNKPLLGKIDQQHVDYVLKSINQGIDTLIQAVPRDATLGITNYEVGEHVIGRRKIFPLILNKNEVKILRALVFPNKRKARHQSAKKLIFFDNENKTEICAIWLMPCHPTSYPLPDVLSAHYIGEVRNHYRNVINNQNLAFVFLQGASGDLRPPAMISPDIVLTKVKKFLYGVFDRRIFMPRFVPFRPEEYMAWTSKLKNGFVEASVKPSSVSSTTLNVEFVEKRLSQHKRSASPNNTILKLSMLTIDELRFIGINAEPSVALGKKIRKVVSRSFSTTDQNIELIGCVGDTFGYISRWYEELFGGYEIEGHLKVFGMERLSIRPLEIDAILLLKKLITISQRKILIDKKECHVQN
jgi:hypothetical protein